MAHQDDHPSFRNEYVDVLVSREPGCLIQFDISVSPKGAEAAYAQALKQSKKEISIPGFRKGKAPDSLIAQNFASYLDQEFRDCLIQTAYKEATQLTNLYPLNQQSFRGKPQLKNYSKEQGAKVVLKFEGYPEVPVVNPEQLQLKQVEKKPVTDQEVQQVIENIRFQNADWEEVAGRPVEEGDYVHLDIEAIENPPHSICSDTRFEVKKGHMADWMIKLILGLNVGQTVEGLSEKPEDNHVHTEDCTHESHQHEFQPTQCRIHVKSIKKPILPEVNDDLAKKVGLQTSAELPERIKADLERRNAEDRKYELRQQLGKLLLEQYPFDVPASLVETESRSRLEGRENANREKAHQKAAEGLQLFFITRKVAEDHRIEVSQQDIVREWSRQMFMVPEHEKIIDSSMDPNEVQSRLYMTLLTDKAKDFLIEKATLIA